MEYMAMGLARELRKLGRLCTEAEFGPYFRLVSGPRAAQRKR